MPEAEERFTVGCPKCGKRYVLTSSAIGKKATCKCGRSFIVEKPPEAKTMTTAEPTTWPRADGGVEANVGWLSEPTVLSFD